MYTCFPVYIFLIKHNFKYILNNLFVTLTLCSQDSFNRVRRGKRDENMKNHVLEFHLTGGGEGKGKKI
ncbi:hypothetical protein HanIR_Chr05g0253731 [Helianthus annuus]|nr:hypothetical protein HanIR_Chr05g0253731 [Helianthus annuus]